MDESTNIIDRAQWVVFIQGAIDDFNIIERLLDLASMMSATIRENLTSEVLKMIKKFKLDTTKLSGLTRDGAPVMVGKHNKFCKNSL